MINIEEDNMDDGDSNQIKSVSHRLLSSTPRAAQGRNKR